jgi:hypothetical protein
VFLKFNPTRRRAFGTGRRARVRWTGDKTIRSDIATNVFPYYDTFEQALALRNISTLLKPGGFFLTNDWLPNASQTPIRSTGYTLVRHGESADWGDNIFWWQRQ